MKDIFTVAKFTIKDMVSRKSFRISTIIILVLIVLGFNVPNFLQSINGNDPDTEQIYILDQDQVFEGKLDALNDPAQEYEVIETTDSEEELRRKFQDGEIDAAVIINDVEGIAVFRYLVANVALSDGFPEGLADRLNNLYSTLQLTKLGLEPDALLKITPNFLFTVEQTDEVEIHGNVFVMMLMSIVLFYAVYFCAYQVSVSITTEKTSKIIETLTTSTSPRNIVLGKTLGIGLVGLFQLILIVGTAIISANLFLDQEMLGQLLDLSNFTPYLALITIVYFILGYATYALLYALSGSTVSKPEDIQAANTPIAIIVMIGFYLAYFTLTDPTSSLNVFAALLPISSPFCMPIRIMMGLASIPEVLLSIAILFVTILLIAHITIRIYSNAILNYGTKMSLGNLLKLYKEK